MNDDTIKPGTRGSSKVVGQMAPAKSRRIIAITIEGDKTFRLDKERVVIGSVISADVRLTGDGIAPIHAVIENTETPIVYDLASETGVFVNGSKVVTSNLKNGDQIKIGSYALKFALEDLQTQVPKELIREFYGQKLFFNAKEDMGSLLLEQERDVHEIFDMRPTTRSALEVVMSWNEVILNVSHFVDQKTVVLGDSLKSDFGIPPLLSSNQHFLAVKEGDRYSISLDPKMSGVIQRKGQLLSLDALRAQSGGASQFQFDKDDFVKITFGEISFYLSYKSAPPRLKMSKMMEKDPLFLKIFFSSLVLTVVTIVALVNAEVPQTLEAEQLPDRIATILFQPEKYISRPKAEVVRAKPDSQTVAAVKPQPIKVAPQPTQPVKIDIKPDLANAKKPVPKEMRVAPKGKSTAVAQAPKSPGKQAKAQEGKGAKAKGVEGTRGSKTAPLVAKQQAQTAAARPSAQGGPGRGSSDSEVPDIGNVDFLKSEGGKIENILGSSAAKLGKGGEKLKGFGGFDTFGGGGLALSGTGKGGGGSAETLGGLANKGRGGGRVGTGMGAAGTGSGIVGGQSRVSIRTGGPEEAVVMGAINAAAVEAALLAHRDEFRLCYERELNTTNQKLSGRVGTTFVIGSSGKVSQAGIESTSLKNVNTEVCILQVIKRIQFPIPRGAGLVQVTYPFKFAQR